MTPEDQLRRPLLHPLRNSGIGGTAAGGQWTPLATPEELMQVAFPEDNPGLGGRVSSVPSPWARLELFRDAIADAPVNESDTDAHPFTATAVQDILDALELLLYQDWMDGLTLGWHALNLDELVDIARREREQGVLRFVRAAQDLAPRVGSDGRLTELIVATDPRANILFATSPFTLFFTPEDQTSDLPGYFAARPQPRSLRERPPELANYLANFLVPRLQRHGSQLPELGRLVGILQRQLAEIDPAVLSPLPEGSFDEQNAVQPISDLPIGKVARLGWESRLSLQTHRIHGTPPLVLNNDVLREERIYFPWITPPQATRIEGASNRARLPGTMWKHSWVEPERDLLVDHLLVLEQRELDLANVVGREIYGIAQPQAEGRRPGQILLPLSSEYFRYFGPEDAVRQLRLAVDPSGRVVATLSVPTVGGTRTFRKVYTRGENLATSTFYLSVWPNFAPADGQFEWPYYSVLHHTVGRSAEEFEILAGVDGSERSQGTAEQGQGLRRFIRDLETAFYFLDRPPEYLRVRLQGNQGDGEPAAEGVVIPRFDTPPAPTGLSWTVALDLGTSNTVVAVRRGLEEPKLLELKEMEGATRRDLVRAPESPVRGSRSDVVRTLDTFFFPTHLRPESFPTVILKSEAHGQRLEEDLQRVPALTANIPFTGDVVSQSTNTIVTDLKWGGGLLQAERNLLTELFLEQVLLLLRAEAVRSGASVEASALRWSYPAAFTIEEYGQLATRWTNVLRWLRESRLGDPPHPSADDAPLHWQPDESTAAFWFFKTHPQFDPNANALAITVDLGGGTTDIAAYGKESGQFRNSILLGGRDLIGWPEEPGTPRDPGARHVENPLYRYIEEWARTRMGRRSNLWTQQLEKTLPQYPTSHARFSYLVRQPWFEEHRAEMKEEPWFRTAQASIVYFFGALFFHLGALVRADMEGGERAYQLPDRVILGGNGSRFLQWLSGFQPWQGSQFAQKYEPVFQALFEAAFGGSVTRLRVLTSTEPKHEVALGLLTSEAESVLRRVAGRQRDLDPPPAAGDDPNAVRSHQPLGEAARFAGMPGVLGAGATLELAAGQASGFAFGGEFERSAIGTFNRAYLENLGRLRTIDPAWDSVRDRIAPVLRDCDRDFYEREVRTELERRLRFNTRLTPSIFAIEVGITLRHLQAALFPENRDGNG